jgi:hypothetical protein
VLCALALRDRDLVRREIVGLRERFRTVGSNVQRRALARLGDQDFFWDMLDDALIEHLNALVGESPSSPEHEQLNEATASALALVAVDSVRLDLPALEEQLPQLPPIQLASVIAARPDPFFVPYIVNLLERAMNWRFGEQVGRLLVAHAPMLTSDQLAEALRKWAHNVDCRSASEMPAAAVEVLHRTAHLGPQRFDLFRSFLDDVRLYSTGQDDYYTYPALKERFRSPRLILCGRPPSMTIPSIDHSLLRDNCPGQRRETRTFESGGHPKSVTKKQPSGAAPSLTGPPHLESPPRPRR